MILSPGSVIRVAVLLLLAVVLQLSFFSQLCILGGHIDVVVVYKVNTGYARVDQTQPGPGLDARFNVQLNQALPFDIAGTRWEILVGLRNLFRDPTDPASVYDELLVVRPPKRVVGGFLVRF